jgi:solute carrier family 6 amino acid transporter-like protein 5/7/9/14/solute carrier family 6 GABA transporter-like protein 6/8/11/12/13
MCGMLAGLVVFSYIGHISHVHNIPINELPV